MLTKSDLEKLANVRLEDSLFLLMAGRFSSAYYLAGYAVELALKACISKLIQPNVIPEKAFVNAIYTHKLDSLLATAGLLPQFIEDTRADSEFAAYWAITQTNGLRKAATNSGIRYLPQRCFRQFRSQIMEFPMGEKALVESQVADAVALIKTLDSEGAAPTLAVWYFYDDAAEWRLIIAGPTFDALPPKQELMAYRKIVEAFAATTTSSLKLSDLKLIRTDTPLPLALQFLVGTGPDDIVRAYFTDTSLNGIFIKEMIVLRSAQSVSPRAA